MQNLEHINKPRRKSYRQKTNAEAIARNERVRKAIQMRKNGFTYEEIAVSLGWKSRQAAFDAVSRVLERALLDDALELKLVNLMRLESLVKVVMAKALEGDLLAVDRIIKISKRESEILGFDVVNNRDLNTGFVIVVKNESDREKGE